MELIYMDASVLKIVLVAALIFYIIVLVAYFFGKNFLVKDGDYRKFLIGPFIVFLVYGLLKSKLLFMNPELQSFTLWMGAVYAGFFIIFYGVTKLLANHILQNNKKELIDFQVRSADTYM
jgi:hypothetical protein